MAKGQLKNTGRFIFESAGGYRPTVQMRPSDRNPLTPGCPMHLRRVCGVCAHFGGGKIVSEGPCAKLGGDVRGGRNAAECADWSRKSAAPATQNAGAS